MKKRKGIIILAIYLSGYIVAYLSVKRDVKSWAFNGHQWTVDDREFALAFSMGSWIAVIPPNLDYYFKDVDPNQHANW